MISVSLASPEVVLDGPATVTASVTNAGEAQERVVLGVFASAGGSGPSGGAEGARGAADPTWATVDRPLREVGAGATEQYAVTITAPDAPAGTYELKLIAHPAAAAPEEYADRGQVLRLVVPPTKAPPSEPGRRWWPWVLGGVLLLVAVGVVVALLLRTPEDPEVPQVTVTAEPVPDPGGGGQETAEPDPGAAVVSRGETTLAGDGEVDLDTGAVDPPRGADLAWLVLELPPGAGDRLIDPGTGLPREVPPLPPGRQEFPGLPGFPGDVQAGFLAPRNGAGLAALTGRSIGDVTAQDLQRLSYSRQPVLGEDLEGRVRSLAFVTDEGRHGAVEVGVRGTELSIRWVTFG